MTAHPAGGQDRDSREGAGTGAPARVTGSHDHDTGAPLVSVEDHLERVLSGAEPLPPVDLPLREAHGCVTVEDVVAASDLPAFSSSAMDGYAVRSSDVAGAAPDRPVSLRIAGRVDMGRLPDARVGPGEAVEIPTGGAVPDGADAVVPIERCIVSPGRVRVSAEVPGGRFVRPAGQDVRAGGMLVPGGRRLMAGDLGLLAAAGLAAVRVRPRVRVGIVSTGDELVEPGDPAADARIPDANAFTLHGAVLEAGAVPVPLGRVPDDPDALLDLMERRAGDVDVVLSSGGVSVGGRDPVRGALGDRASVDFVEVAMQPGKPQAFGTVGARPFFGLPGNPVSVFVSFEVFVRPALLRMMGRTDRRPEVGARLATDVPSRPEKTVFARVRVRRRGDGWLAMAVGERGSNLVATVSRADGLAVVPPGAEGTAGSTCRVLLVRDLEVT